MKTKTTKIFLRDLPDTVKSRCPKNVNKGHSSQDFFGPPPKRVTRKAYNDQPRLSGAAFTPSTLTNIRTCLIAEGKGKGPVTVVVDEEHEQFNTIIGQAKAAGVAVVDVELEVASGFPTLMEELD